MTSTNFTFNGITSESMGIYLVRTSGGMVTTPFVPSREIKDDFPFKAKQPYHFGIQNQQQTIPLTSSTLTNDMTDSKMKEIADWLFQDEYMEFYSEDNTDKIYYLMAVSETPRILNASKEGYIEVQFKSKFPYALMASTTPTYEVTGSDTISIDNESNTSKYFFPIMEITVGTPAIDVTITNTSDSSRLTSFGGLTTGEVIYVDNNKKQIISDLDNLLYDDFNKNWLRFIQGNNSLDIVGNCTIEFRIQYPIFT